MTEGKGASFGRLGWVDAQVLCNKS
jgi:hypothetical protein